MGKGAAWHAADALLALRACANVEERTASCLPTDAIGAMKREDIYRLWVQWTGIRDLTSRWQQALCITNHCPVRFAEVEYSQYILTLPWIRAIALTK